MKRVIVVILSLLILCAVSACAETNNASLEVNAETTGISTETSTPNPTEAPTPEPTEPPASWQVYEEKDEFGDVVGKQVVGIFYGTYVRASSGIFDKPAKLFIYGVWPFAVHFRVYEDDIYEKRFYSSYSPTCAFKIDDEKYSATLVPLEDYLLLAENWDGQDIAVGMPKKLIGAIESNKEIPFIIKTRDTTYTFQIDGNGYCEAKEEAKSK